MKKRLWPLWTVGTLALLASCDAFSYIPEDEEEVESLSLEGELTKTAYYTDDVWNPAGLTLYALYSNNDKADVTKDADVTWAYSPALPELNATSLSITAEFKGATVSRSFTVTVEQADPMRAVVSLSVGGALAKTLYRSSDSWSADGLTVQATLKNGEVEDVSDDPGVTWTFDPESPALGVSSLGVTATYKKVSSEKKNFDVKVSDTINPAKISVKTYDGGFGMDWLRNAAKKFTTLVQNKQWSDGTVGVDITVDGDKTVTGSTLLSSQLDSDIYFTEMVDVVNFIKNDKLYDISSIVTQPFDSIFGESGKIEDKLALEYQNYLKQVDGKYYALPFYDGIWSVICDVDYFLSRGYMFYDSTYAGTNGQSGIIGCSAEDVADNPHAISKGLDGVWGTYDDGLPTSFAEWNTLCTAIRNDGVIPFGTYGGGQEDYVDQAIKNVWATIEGPDKFKTQLNMSGQLDVIDVDNWTGAGTYRTKKQTIDDDHIYMCQRTPGKYEAFHFMDSVITGNGNYDSAAGNYRNMQQLFIVTPYQETEQATRYAMIIDGTWWTNEAKDTFTQQKQQGKPGALDRRFVFMPMPTVNGGHSKSCYVSQNESFCFMRKNPTNAEASKLFLQYLHTNQAMVDFTRLTGTTRALNVNFPADWQIGKDISYFTASIIDMKQNSSSEILYPYTNNPVVGLNYSEFDYRKTWPFKAKIGNLETTSPFVEMRNNTATAYSYFQGHISYFNQAWNNSLRRS